MGACNGVRLTLIKGGARKGPLFQQRVASMEYSPYLYDIKLKYNAYENYTDIGF